MGFGIFWVVWEASFGVDIGVKTEEKFSNFEVRWETYN
jgi:hypothetical protein